MTRASRVALNFLQLIGIACKESMITIRPTRSGDKCSPRPSLRGLLQFATVPDAMVGRRFGPSRARHRASFSCTPVGQEAEVANRTKQMQHVQGNRRITHRIQGYPFRAPVRVILPIELTRRSRGDQTRLLIATRWS